MTDLKLAKDFLYLALCNLASARQALMDAREDDPSLHASEALFWSVQAQCETKTAIECVEQCAAGKVSGVRSIPVRPASQDAAVEGRDGCSL